MFHVKYQAHGPTGGINYLQIQSSSMSDGQARFTSNRQKALLLPEPMAREELAKLSIGAWMVQAEPADRKMPY